MEKKYISQTNCRAPRPRSKRLREQGIGSTSSTIVLSGAAGGSSAQQGDGHTHANKSALDQISTDGDGYEYITRLKPVTTVDEETGEEITTYERVTEKVKAGYADEAGVARELADGSALDGKYLSKLNPDTAAGLITFLQGLIAEGRISAREGLVIGEFVAGFVGGMGGMIDKEGNAELKSLRLREFLEVPELRNNRIDVVSGELWNSICFGTIERVDERKRMAWLKLQDGELSGIEVGDICRGVFHCLEGENPSESKEDECGFLQLAGFATSYFTPTAVYDNGASFKYSLRQGTSVHPQVGMKFAVYGSFSNPARRASAYMTRTYTRYLNKVDTWQVRPDVHIYGQTGDLEGLTISGVEMHGYGAYLHNLYLSGVHVEFDRDWLDHNLPDVYTVVLSTYERTLVTDIEGNPLNGLEELRNVTTGEGNVVSGEDNVIATRLALTTTVQAMKNGKPMLFSEVMDEGKFLVELNCVGCTARCENGVVKVTSIDMESAEHRVYIYVNCEGEGVYQQEFNVPVVKQGENGVTADLDNEMATVATNDKGEVIAMPEIVSNGRMWYGNEPMLLTRAEIEVPSGISIKNITEDKTSAEYVWLLPLAADKISCKIEVEGITAAAADVNNIKVTMTGRMPRRGVVDSDGNQAYGNVEYTKSVVFKLNKAKMGENALNYQLLPSITEIKATADGTLSESSISCGVTASDGKSLSTLSSLPTGLTMTYKVYNQSSTSSELTYSFGSQLSLSGLGITKDSVRIVFYLYWKGVLIDKEGVPVVANGEDGEDGKGIDSVEVRFNVGDDYRYNYCTFKSSTWTTSSPAVDYTYKYLWKRTRTYYTDGSYDSYKYECVGKIGDKGIDGNGVDYAYCRTTTESAPTKPSGNTPITTNTGTWTDDPQGVTEEYPFEWVSEMKSIEGEWQGYGTPSLWARYAKDGAQGEPGEPGEPGESATSYWFDIPVKYIGLGASGNWQPTSLTITMKKKSGTGAIEDCEDYYLSAWGYDGSKYKKIASNNSKGATLEVSTSSAGDYSSFVVIATESIIILTWDETKVKFRDTIAISASGQNIAGTALIDQGIFSTSGEYYWTYDSARGCWLRDMVLYKNGNKYYRYGVKSMGATVKGSAGNPASSSAWEQLSTYQCVIADTIFGDAANIGGFITNEEKMTSLSKDSLGAPNITLDGKNGNITISGKLKATDAEITGVITATSGTFDNCTINDTCTITKIDAVKGTIGGMTIGNNSISSSTNGSMILNSGGLSCDYNGAYMYSGVINFIDISNGSVSKTSASIEIGNSSTGLQAMINLTNTFAMFKVPIYLPSLPKYASAKSGQLCVGDGDQHIYLKP